MASVRPSPGAPLGGPIREIAEIGEENHPLRVRVNRRGGFNKPMQKPFNSPVYKP